MFQLVGKWLMLNVIPSTGINQPQKTDGKYYVCTYVCMYGTYV